MLLSRIFKEIDARGRQYIRKQYVQAYYIRPCSGYIDILTTRDRTMAKRLSEKECNMILEKTAHYKQRFTIEAETN